MQWESTTIVQANMDIKKLDVARIGLCLVGALVISSCSGGITINRHIDIDRDSIKVNCILQRLAPFGEDTSTAIYAQLTIANTTNRQLKFNLHQLSLNVPKRKSYGPYIDSITDVLIKDEILPTNGFVRYKVYWAFRPPVTASEIDQATLTLVP